MTTSGAESFPVRLTTTRWGRADARPRALLLHGLTSAGGTWWRVASALAGAGWSVTAPDLRGHGSSPRTTSYRLADYAADVLAFEPETPTWDLVVGHSLGGAVAVVAADARPGWAAALLLVDPALTQPLERQNTRLAELLADLGRLDPAELLSANPSWHPEDAVQKVNAMRVVSPFVVERTMRDNPTWQLVDTAARVDAPMRILGADPGRSPSFTAAEAERLSAAAPHRFSFAVVAGAGHSIQRDDADRVAAEALAMGVPPRP